MIILLLIYHNFINFITYSYIFKVSLECSDVTNANSKKQLKHSKTTIISDILNINPVMTFPTSSFLLNDLLKQDKKFMVPQVSLLNNIFLQNKNTTNTTISNSSTTTTYNNNNNNNNSSNNRKNYNHIPLIRFVPKANSVRAITNLSRYNKKLNYKNSNDILSNASLYNCLHVLRYIQLSNPHLCGFGVFGTDDIYFRLSNYKSKLLSGFKTLECNVNNKNLTTTNNNNNNTVINNNNSNTQPIIVII